jgi:hypothetical protein
MSRNVIALVLCLIAPAPAPARADERSATMARLAERLIAECRRAAGDDWDKWQRQLQPFRDQLKALVKKAESQVPAAAPNQRPPDALLEAPGRVPLFEVDPKWQVRYLIEPESLKTWQSEDPVTKVAKWLRERDIDLIFVPIPKMTEVYAARMVAATPRDGIVAPHMRKLMLDLVRKDVEVVDLLPAFLGAPRRDAEPLYHAADPHWSQRGRRVAAAAIGERLRRYEFVQDALKRRKAFRFETTETTVRGAAWDAMSAAQRARVAPATIERGLKVVANARPAIVSDSPVLFIGDSYNYGLAEFVAAELNMSVSSLANGAQTTGAIAAMVRDPSLLADRRVVVWVNTTLALMMDWPLPPLEAARSSRPRPADDRSDRFAHPRHEDHR